MAPVSARLLESVKIWSDDGKAEGNGGCKLLLSRCSSAKEKDEIDSGIEVESPAAVMDLFGALVFCSRLMDRCVKYANLFKR